MRSPSVSLVLVFMLVVSVGGVLFGCEGTPDTPNTGTANTPNANFQALTPLTASDVQTVIAQAVAQAVASKVDATIAVVDRGGNVLGVFEMTKAIGKNTVIGSSSSPLCVQGVADPNICGLEGQPVPFTLAAISKAGTGAFLSSNGNAFSTRTAGDIVQQHRPVGVQGVLSGPLFGVQFSSLPCTDIKNNPPLPLGLAADPGGMPLYKNGSLVGGIGVEADGRYSLQRDPFDTSTPVEELIAIAGSRGFEAPSGIRSDQILLDGVRLPYSNADQSQTSSATMSFNEALGFGRVVPADPVTFPIFFTGTIRDTPDPTFNFRFDNIAGRDVRIALNPDRTDRFRIRAGSGLTAQEVDRILTQGIETAYKLRAAIREPQDSFVQVNVFVVDVDGSVLGYRGTPDAPFFGFDVAAQKARAAAFFSSRNAGNELHRAGSLVGSFADRAQLDGIALDGSIAFSNRGMGFLHRPFFPDGIDSTPPGPFSNALPEWSPFNVGLQLALVQQTLFDILANGVGAIPQDPVTGSRCTDRSITGIQNGTQIFAGSVPLYKNGQLVGGVGVSGDGIDQDDNVAFGGGTGFEPPLAIRCDQVVVQRGNDDGTRLPYVKLPRNPTDF
jgi:uncharacterized protein GlcG (DUF336 family)